MTVSMPSSRVPRYRADPTVKIVSGVCPHDCPDTCSWQVAVDVPSGQARDIWGRADHSVTQGKLCGKVDRYLERTYHPSRLKTPLKRVGSKGEGRFEPISWVQAIQDISARLQAIAAIDGAEAILPYSYAGTMGLLQQEGMATQLWGRLGVSRLARTICSQAGFEGYSYTVGSTVAMEMESFAHAQLILIWGSNTLTSNLHLWPFIQQARKAGARLIVIDPICTRTAQAADDWIPIRPGSDAALALAMMHVIVGEELHDADYVARHTLGFGALQRRVAAWTPARAAEVTGIASARIEALARAYAAAAPAAIRINYGLQRHHGGGMAVRAISCLPALTGAWRQVGGGIQLSTSGSFRHLNGAIFSRPDHRFGHNPRTINMNRLGDALSLDPARIAASHYHPRPIDVVPTPDKAGPPVKALVVYNANPAAVAPDQAAVVAGLKREDLFTVVLEHFQTDTADYADYLLPATTQLEHWDLMKAYGHLYLSLNQPAIDPVGESLSNAEIFRRLGRACGFSDECFHVDDAALLREFVEAQTHPDFEGVTWERLLEQGFVRLNLPTPYLPFAEGDFPTPSGKCEFYSQRLADDGYDPVPTYIPPVHQAAPDLLAPANADGDALVCLSTPAHSFLNSTFANLERFRRREVEPELRMNPLDAHQRALADGDRVCVRNVLGTLELPLRVTEEIIPGTVQAPGVWWSKHAPDHVNINQITPQWEADMGGGSLLYDTLVWVEKQI